jgi:hypothetical protein
VKSKKPASAASVTNTFPYSSIPKRRSLCIRFSPVEL